MFFNRFIKISALLVAGLFSIEASALVLPESLEDEAGVMVMKQLESYPGHNNGDEFNYYQYIPNNHSLPKLGVIVMAHGSLGEDDVDAVLGGTDMINLWKNIAEEKQMMLIAPAFNDKNFGGVAGPMGGYRGLYGRHFDGYDFRSTDADSVVNGVIDSYQASFPGVFEEKIYLTGHSAGGQFTSRYLILHSDRLKAAVIGSGGYVPMPTNDYCWPNGMRRTCRMEDNGTENDLYLDWDIDGLSVRHATFDPDDNLWNIAATKKFTVLAGSEEGDTTLNAIAWHDAMRGLLDPSVDDLEGTQINIVENGTHWGTILYPETSLSLLPEVHGGWFGSGGNTANAVGNPKYTFELAEAQRTKIEIVSESDAILYLLDSNGNIIALDDDSGEGTDAKIILDLDAGIYTIVAATKDINVVDTFDIWVNVPKETTIYEVPEIPNDSGTDYRVDLCFAAGVGCGFEITATAWCEQYTPYDRALNFEHETNVGATQHTKRIGDGYVCSSSNCGAFRNIECMNYNDTAKMCSARTATVQDHVNAGRAYQKDTVIETEEEVETCSGWWWYQTCETEIIITTEVIPTWFASGSDENLGTDSTVEVTLKEEQTGVFAQGACPAESTPPVVSLTSSNLTNGILHVDGTVTDINNDVDQVYLGFPPAFGTICAVNGESVSCDLDVSDMQEGTHTASFYAVDLDGQSSNVIEIDFTIEPNNAPAISNLAHSVDGVNMAVSANVVDQDNNLDVVRVEYVGDIGQTECQNTSGDQFECNVTNHPVGTYTFILVAIDAEGARTESAPFTVTFEEPQIQCFTSTNAVHIDEGRAYMLYNILVYANGSDEYLGMSTATTSLEQDVNGDWNKVTSCP